MFNLPRGQRPTLRRPLTLLTTGVVALGLFGGGVAVAAAPKEACLSVYKKTTASYLKAYIDCRTNRLDAAVEAQAAEQARQAAALKSVQEQLEKVATPAPATTVTATPAPAPAVTVTLPAATVPPVPGPTVTLPPLPGPTVTVTPAPAPTVTVTVTPKPSQTPIPSPTSAPTVTPSATSTNVSGYKTNETWATSVLARINEQRAENNLPALTRNTQLNASAHTHNVAMAQVDTLSHQLNGEDSLGTRVTTTGYVWSTVGENIAWNGRVSEAGVLAVQDSMYNEAAPNDGHRRNMLSTSFTEVGVDVLVDTVHNKVWLVTDFGHGR